MTKTAREILDGVVIKVDTAQEGELLKPIIDQALKELEAIHQQEIAKERIDALEYAKISPKFKIEEKIEQLRLELKKYEQTNDQSS